MFGIKLDADNRIVDFVNESHITDGMITLAELPGGFLRDNVYTDEEFVCLPLPFGNDETSPCATTTEEIAADIAAIPPPEPTPQDDTDALLADHEERLIYMELGV